MKKFLTLLLSMCMLLCVGIGLTACGDKGCEHSYRESVTNPTCTERGYTTFTCDLCGDSYVDRYVEAFNHSNRTWVDEEPATPDVGDGVLGHYHCLDCEKNFDEQGNELNDVILHSFSEWIPAQAATCESEGTIGFYVCYGCNKFFDTDKSEISEENAIIPKSNHTFGEWINEIPSTCKDEGTLGHYYCSVCEKNFDDNETELSSLTISVNENHDCGEWIEEVSSTCEEEGTLEHYHCSVCNKDFDENKNELTSLVIPATGHQIPQSYSYDGAKHTYTCVCGEVEAAHNFKDSVCVCGITYEMSRMTFQEVEGGYKLVKGYGKTIPSTYNGRTVMSIGANAFSDSYITSITIPASIKDIGGAAFENRSELKEIVFEDDSMLESIGGYAFYGTALQSIALPQTLKTIGSRAFEDCKSLKSITIPACVEKLGNQAFSSCEELASVVFEKGSKVTVVEKMTFWCCTKLTTVELPDGLTAVENEAFYRCPVGLNYENGVYLGNTTNPYIVLLDVVDVTCTSFTVHKNTRVMYNRAFYGESSNDKCTVLEEVIFESGSKLVNIPESMFSGLPALARITIPTSVETIGNYAFYTCANLVSLNFEQNAKLKSIGELAFSGTGITSVKIPALVETIGDEAFDTQSINLIEFEEGSILKRIGQQAFYRCELSAPVSLPSSVEYVYAKSFGRSAYNIYNYSYYLGNEENPYRIYVEVQQSASMQVDGVWKTVAFISDKTEIIADGTTFAATEVRCEFTESKWSKVVILGEMPESEQDKLVFEIE